MEDKNETKRQRGINRLNTIEEQGLRNVPPHLLHFQYYCLAIVNMRRLTMRRRDGENIRT